MATLGPRVGLIFIPLYVVYGIFSWVFGKNNNKISRRTSLNDTWRSWRVHISPRYVWTGSYLKLQLPPGCIDENVNKVQSRIMDCKIASFKIKLSGNIRCVFFNGNSFFYHSFIWVHFFPVTLSAIFLEQLVFCQRSCWSSSYFVRTSRFCVVHLSLSSYPIRLKCYWNWKAR